jgi:DNA mismatch repair ATPase MutS
LAPEIAILSEGLTLLAAQSFEAPKLRALQEKAAALPARIRGLARLTHWARERDRDWLGGIASYLFMGTQLAMALERWRIRHAPALREALDIWSEFEALEAIGTYAHEHPTDLYPEFTDACQYDAQDLGHPLLPEDICIRNDVHFDQECRLWIISGSNMAGKSTLLRSVGISVVLALAGAPVRATRMVLAPLHLCASIGVPDSLLDGKSRFQAEVERIRDSIAAAAKAPALFLIDEIFSGTNSHDRRIAAEAVVRTLLSHGAIGALSTHDLALTEIATFPGLAGQNVHMCSRSDDAALDFDYRLKPGVNRQSNALAIARLAGVPV